MWGVAVPVHIISGFLGTGKTTTIRAQLAARRGERIAVIVNDFGDAALDEVSLSEEAPFQITNIAGACVCCTAPEGFVDALGAVLEGRPERLIIEPTGLARPQDLVDTIRRCPHRDALELGPVVVLIDPARLGDAASDATWREQAEAADVIVANRTDLCEAEDLARFDAWVAERWPAPLQVHRTDHGRIPASLLEWPEGRVPPGAHEARHAHQSSPGGHEAGHAHQPSTGDHVARSWRFPPEVVFAHERLVEFLDRLVAGDAGAPLVRFKGVFHTREGVFRMEVAGGVRHEAPSAFRRDSRADAIFTGNADAPGDAATGWIEAAVLTAEELSQQAHQIELVQADGRIDVVDRDVLCALPDGVDDVSVLVPGRNGSAARVGQLFERLGLGGAGSAVICAADGFASEPVNLAALAQGVLLHSLDGVPLPVEKGGPFRLLIPEGVEDAPSACANVKAVTRIVVRNTDLTA